ncbi:MAG: 5,6-dimethylbenzimidazole synthase [Porticoccaceae bacterium]|nr:MAG: 5,6-dimethylbenzimidazole synthase [Porticoccaceae bacterium]
MAPTGQRPGRYRTHSPHFDAAFRRRLETLFRWRRDVRRFRADPLPSGLVERLLAQADAAPSVGNSQPWRFVVVEDEGRRRAARAHFAAVNERALAGYRGERARLYASLKLEGMDRAPVQLVAFCDPDTDQGHGLGRLTMPQTLEWSVVLAIAQLWLAARAHGVGLGWVSLLEPAVVAEILAVPQRWRFIGWLCLGYPEEESPEPELERLGWQRRTPLGERIFHR